MAQEIAFVIDPLLPPTPTVTAYTFDDANRLATVNTLPYTFDANGNLLSDAEYTYSYDSANRLTGVTKAESTVSYRYNGDGDRLQQTVNGVENNYTLDLNSGLTQVLAYGDETYSYGLDRLGYSKYDDMYTYLPDALGSVRQVIKTSGEYPGLTLAKSYDPYGEVIYSNGAATSYGFTGEAQDSTGMEYLRARYYNASTGTFMSRDTWDGDANQPMSYNRWMYTYGNPVNYTDPSGNFRFIGCVVTADTKGANWPQKEIDDRVDEAEKYVSKTSDPMDTYTAAGIAVQCAGNDAWDDYNGTGIAQISKKQATTEYGKKITTKELKGWKIVEVVRGFGLCKGDETPLDPNNTKDAVILMKRRIELVIQYCKVKGGKCTPTDNFIAASLAQNGPGFAQDAMGEIGSLTPQQKLDHKLVPLGQNPEKIGISPIEKNWYDAFTNRKAIDTTVQLNRFLHVIHELEARGWNTDYVPWVVDSIKNIKRTK